MKAGTDYAAAIMDAIRNSQLVVLIFSAHSNASPYALREIERSVAYGRPVLALRTDDADPTPSLEYYLHDWIEAPEGVESKRKEIIAAVRRAVGPALAGSHEWGGGRCPRSKTSCADSSLAPAKRPPKRAPWYRRTWVIAVAAVLVVAAVGLGLGLGLTRDQAVPPPARREPHRLDRAQALGDAALGPRRARDGCTIRPADG